MQSSNRYETYQTGFQFEGLGPSPLGGLRGWAEAKIKLFQNMVMLHIKLKLTTLAATWKHIFCRYLVGIKDNYKSFNEFDSRPLLTNNFSVITLCLQQLHGADPRMCHSNG